MPQRAQKPTALGIKLAVAADEYWIFAVVYLFFHTILLLLNVLWLFAFTGQIILTDCDSLDEAIYADQEGVEDFVAELTLHEDLQNLYLLLSAVIVALSLVLWATVFWVSTTGDVFEHKKRQLLTFPLSLLVLLTAVEVLSSLFGIYVIASYFYELLDTATFEDVSCRNEARTRFTLLAVWNVFMLLDLFWFFLGLNIIVDRTDSLSMPESDSHSVASDIEFQYRKREWEKRCRIWCYGLKCFTCGFFGAVKKKGENVDYAFKQVGEVCGKYFTGHDANFSDFLVGVLLLRAVRLAENRKKAIRLWKEDSQRFSYNASQRKLSEELDDLLHNDFDIGKYRHRLGELYPALYQSEDTAIDETGQKTSLRKELEPLENVEKKKKQALISEATKLNKLEHSEVDMLKVKKMQKKAKQRPAFDMKKSALKLHPSDQNRLYMRLLQQYSPYMMGLYGWKLLLYLDALELRPLRNIGHLFGFSSKMKADSVFSNKKSLVSHDTCCNSQSNALLRMTNSVKENLIFASYVSIEGKN